MTPLVVPTGREAHLAQDSIPFGSCGVSHLCPAAAAAITETGEIFVRLGYGAFKDQRISGANRLFRETAGALFGVAPEGISYVDNVAVGLNLIAMGLELQPEDEIVLYNREYPSNVFPWSRPGSTHAGTVKLVTGSSFGERALGVKLADFEAAISAQTKVLALSSVQYTSGFAANLAEVGEFCRQRGIVFVVDAAQSAGCMPLYPEQIHADAVVSSGWKWLAGPIGSGVLWTSAKLRERLKIVLFGPDMRKEPSYEDPAFTAVEDGGKLEPSSLPKVQVRGLTAAIARLNEFGIEKVWQLTQRNQDLFLSLLDQRNLVRAPLAEGERSGILSFVVRGDPAAVVSKLQAAGVSVPSPRGGYLRFAPPYYLTEAEVREAAKRCNGVLGEGA